MTRLSPYQDRVSVLQQRNARFWEYIHSKVTTGETDIKKLRDISKLSAHRTITELQSIIYSFDHPNTDVWAATITVREAQRQTYIGVQDALLECQKLLESIQSDTPKNFLKAFSNIHSKLSDIFTYIEKTKGFILQELSKKDTKYLRWFLDVITTGGHIIQNAWKRISQVVMIGALSTSIATAWTQSIDILQEQNIHKNAVEQIIEWSQWNKFSPLLLQIQSDFHQLQKIPDFEQKINRITQRFQTESLFQPKNYVRQVTWKLWNDEIVSELFPQSAHRMSEWEKKIIIQALQKYYNTPTKDGEFWRSSRNVLLQKMMIRPLSFSLNKQPVSSTPEIVKKRITLQEFEEALLHLEWTKYVSWLFDCSWLFFSVFKKLQLIDFQLLKNVQHRSTSIIKQLTVNKEDFKEARKWDFIYWSSSKYKWQKHIAYIFDINDTGVYIFDRSIDTGTTVKRFVSWWKLAQKKDCIVGTPIFLSDVG